ncbi:MAG: GNAT family N-acetyltransferase [Pseudomonadota bacterium]
MGDIITYYLEMKSPAGLVAKPPVTDLQVNEVRIDSFPLNKFLYEYVGKPWGWVDKLVWTDEQWRQWVEQPGLRTWVAYHLGAPAGYFELHKPSSEQVEIAYFGLARNFIGLGFGGYLLSSAIQNAWEWGNVRRVWVHTCTLDHPGALKNYQARGFEIYKTETE